MVEYIIEPMDIVEEMRTEDGLYEHLINLYYINCSKADYKIKYDFIGFNYEDKDILTSISEWYIEHEFLTYKQKQVVNRLLFKYASQLADFYSMLNNM